MRKVEQQMIAAIQSRRDWCGGNTQVSVEPAVIRVFLHGNHIANVRNQGRALDVSLAGWNTNTTRSRLSALVSALMPEPGPHGCGVSAKQGTPYLHDASGRTAISERGWFPVKLTGEPRANAA